MQWWLFDSYAQPPTPASGSWTVTTEGAQLAIAKTTPRGTAWHRFTVAADELSYEIDLELEGDPEPARFLTGHYRRISGH